jgi:hypothetical protein
MSLEGASSPQDETYDHFTDLYDIPYTVVTVIYILALLLISIIVAVRRCKCCKGCCDILKDSAPVKLVDQFNRWLVKLVFGNTEGIGDQENEVDKIHDTTIKALDINILGTIILCFGLLMAIAAYGVYMLEVSHTCSEDPAIYCFPRFIDEGNQENPNITAEEMKYPITDCSVWVNSSIAPLITFQCFRYAYNAQAALATAGGLLAFFTLAMRITITMFLKVFKLFSSCGRCLIVFQVIAVILLLVFDVIIAAVVMSFQLYTQLGMVESGTSPVAQQTASYIADNGLQLLVIMGTTTLLLLIPWSSYVD